MKISTFCSHCGVRFEYERKPGGGRLRRFCSDGCKKIAMERARSEWKRKNGNRCLNAKACAHCAREFRPKTYKQAYCSHKCYCDANRVWGLKPCAHCGSEFQTAPQKARFCSLECSIVAVKRYGSEKERGVAKQGRRRARMVCSEVEPLVPREIYDRDGWRCGICGGRVDKRLKYPNPKSATLDHIEPIANGGSHTAKNAQLAHFSCNSRKGARAGGQLRLFG